MSDNHIKTNTPVFKLNVPDDNFKFQPLPAPTGAYPYRLPLHQVLTPADNNKMVLHMVGDTGSARQPGFQQKVAREMRRQFEQAPTPAEAPQFLYHLGDVVYHFGEASEYYRQFFHPYQHYPAPIFAIAGNHDSDINPGAIVPYKSLDAFVQVFCSKQAQPLDIAGDSGRLAITQPNVYWTLPTPVANIIGLYSNVPKFGKITAEQTAWLVEELQHAASQQHEKAIVLCVHHAPFSADANHGASREMITTLNHAFALAGVEPDIVFSGHVHNYQRFSKQRADGRATPYIVAGAGGYVTLFPVVTAGQPGYTANDPLLQDVTLEKFCDTAHGFLKVTIERTSQAISIKLQYYTITPDAEGEDVEAHLFDEFRVVREVSGEL